MTISFARVDNRLIHGQIVQGWLPVIKADEVVVISDQAAKSTLMSKMLRMALPSNYSFKIVPVKEAAAYLSQSTEKTLFVLIEDFSFLGQIAQDGFLFDTVNIGNTKYEDTRKEIQEGVYFTQEDLALAQELKKKGVKFDVRSVPSELSVRLV